MGKNQQYHLTTPKYVRQAGRPKESSRRDITEIKSCKGKQVLTRWHSHTCNYYGVQDHNVRTCAKKKGEYEGEGSGDPSRGESARGESAVEESTRGENGGLSRGEIVEGESARGEDATQNRNQAELSFVKLLNLYDWMNMMKSIVPLTPVTQKTTLPQKGPSLKILEAQPEQQKEAPP
ncbi:hypothetical protein LIER_43478 [Lithospermum erythrorhizon]|uniref:Uncharacterized protein n=1 Tax=Lithospermum erythrorhizon TaxID=34254 RepID=A0AAV3Q5N4_LITER